MRQPTFSGLHMQSRERFAITTSIARLDIREAGGPEILPRHADGAVALDGCTAGPAIRLERSGGLRLAITGGNLAGPAVSP